MLFVLNMYNFMCLDLNNFCCFSQIPPVLEPARPLLGRNKGRGTSKQDEKEGGGGAVSLRNALFMIFFLKELESHAEIESSLLLTLVMDLRNVSLSHEIPVAFCSLAPTGHVYRAVTDIRGDWMLEGCSKTPTCDVCLISI